MSCTLNIRCNCGKFTASAVLPDKEKSTRLVCFCNDCQSSARHLGAGERILDEQGGTALLQMSPANFKIKRGGEHLAVLRLSPRGIFRWYAKCCQSPIGNTPHDMKMPFLGIINDAIVVKAGNEKDSSLDELIGPISFGVCAGEQHPIERPWPVYKGFGLRGIASTLRNIARWRLRGDHQRNPFFNQEGEPVETPYVLTLDERTAAST